MKLDYTMMESFPDLIPDKKEAYLRYILLRDQYFDGKTKDWLRTILKSEKDDLFRAMVVDALGTHIDEVEIRNDLEKLIPESPKDSLTDSAIKELSITALSDDMADVRNWGIRLIREHEHINPEDQAELFHYLAKILEHENLVPRLRWCAALALARLGSRSSVDKLIECGKNLARKIPDHSEADTYESDQAVFLSEKVCFSLGLACKKVYKYWKTREVLELLKTVNQRIDDGQSNAGPVIWAIQKIENNQPLWQKFWENIMSGFSKIRFPEFNPMRKAFAVAACIVLFCITMTSYLVRIPPSVFISLTDKTGKPLSELTIKTRSADKSVILKTGDEFRAAIDIDKDTYVYVLFYDSLGEISVWFFGDTNKDGISDKIAAGRLELPYEQSCFVLDENTGTETIYVLTSKKAIDEFPGKTDELKISGISEIKGLFPEAVVNTYSFEHVRGQ